MIRMSEIHRRLSDIYGKQLHDAKYTIPTRDQFYSMALHEMDKRKDILRENNKNYCQECYSFLTEKYKMGEYFKLCPKCNKDLL